MLLLGFFTVFLLLIVASCPVAFSMVLSSLAYILMRGSINLTIIPERMHAGLDSFPLIAVPLFILAGRIMNNSGITRRIFGFCMAFVGHLKAGLAYVNVIASIIFAGITGSSVADVAGLGSVEIKAMNDEGYDPAYSCAVTAASSCVGPIVPPSIIMIVIGVMAEISIGRLFAGGLIPGLLMGLSLLTLVFVHTRVKPHYFPPPRKKLTLVEKWKATKDGLPSVLSPVIILAGILSGAVTPSEAGVIAVVYSVLLGAVYRELHIRDLPEILKEAALSTGVVLFVIASAQMFGWVVTVERIAHALNIFVSQTQLPSWMILLMVNLGVVLLGCFIEGTAVIMIVVPVLLPMMVDMGINPIQFASFLAVNIMIGLLTPPVGLSVYIASEIAGVPVMKGFRRTIVFAIPIVIVLLMTTYIPAVSVWLPNLLFG